MKKNVNCVCFQVKGTMDGIPVMLVGNKCDEESGKREVSKKTGEALQVKLQSLYVKIGVPTRESSSRRILKDRVLSRVEAE